MKLFLYRLREVVRKEFLTAVRERAIFATMLMFSLTALACVSLAIRGAYLDAEILAALLWIIIFFAENSLAATFDDEAITALKVYADAQTVLFGKMIFSFLTSAATIIFLLPIFVILFDVQIFSPAILITTIFFGLVGISGAGTLISAISASAKVRGGLFPILLFPIILPLFLSAISLTAPTFQGAEVSANFLPAMILFDAILITAASILFDYLWY